MADESADCICKASPPTGYLKGRIWLDLVGFARTHLDRPINKHAGFIVSLPAIPPFHEPLAHWNHRLTLRLATILPLLGERAGVRADVSSSRRDWLPPRFRVREQFPSEQSTFHEPLAHWNHRLTLRLATILSPGGEGRGEGEREQRLMTNSPLLSQPLPHPFQRSDSVGFRRLWAWDFRLWTCFPGLSRTQLDHPARPFVHLIPAGHSAPKIHRYLPLLGVIYR